MQTTQPIVIAEAVRVELHSALNHRRYSISVAPPLVTPRQARCPVIYVLDAYWFFGSVVEAVRFNAPGVVVVGIGYPDDEAHAQSVLERHRPLPGWAKDLPASKAAVGLERGYDLTLPASEAVLAAEHTPDSHIRPGDVGGLDGFLKVIEAEIKPLVGRMTAIDCSNQAVFGHSLAGMAVLHALFTQPIAFRTFIASSPSIWWSRKAVLAGEAAFSDVVRAGAAAPRVLITAASEEETPKPQHAAKSGQGFAEYARRIRECRMVGNACDLADRLKALRGSNDFEVEGHVFPKQVHGAAFWSALGRAVSFAFPP